MPEFNVGELVFISDLVYPVPNDLEALIIDYISALDEIDGSRTYEYEVITEKYGITKVVPERFLDRDIQSKSE
jgi:hypothetical protein